MSEVNNLEEQQEENTQEQDSQESIADGIPHISVTLRVSNLAQTPTDKTLLIEDMPADAKATGQAIDNAKAELQTQINNLGTDINAIYGALFPVGCIYVSTSDTAPTFGAQSWRWEEIMIPVSQGDLIHGRRSYTAKGENDTTGTLHFWKRIENVEVVTA